MRPSLAAAAPPGHDHLHHLLAERARHPERVAEIDAEVWKAFGKPVAVLVMDMCGFSKFTSHYGIVACLGKIRQMMALVGPEVARHRGRVVKHDADNLFAVFDHPADALEAARGAFRAFVAADVEVPDAHHALRGSVGIGFGDTLLIGEGDLFGHEVNLAAKLGEDLADGMEILLTPAAHALLPAGRYAFTPARYTISNLVVDAFRLHG